MLTNTLRGAAAAVCGSVYVGFMVLPYVAAEERIGTTGGGELFYFPQGGGVLFCEIHAATLRHRSKLNRGFLLE